MSVLTPCLFHAHSLYKALVFGVRGVQSWASAHRQLPAPRSLSHVSLHVSYVPPSHLRISCKNHTSLSLTYWVLAMLLSPKVPSDDTFGLSDAFTYFSTLSGFIEVEFECHTVSFRWHFYFFPPLMAVANPVLHMAERMISLELMKLPYGISWQV